MNKNLGIVVGVVFLVPVLVLFAFLQTSPLPIDLRLEADLNSFRKKHHCEKDAGVVKKVSGYDYWKCDGFSLVTESPMTVEKQNKDRNVSR